ncbi:asparagine synthase (glutamine-hydrolyzing) [uncultured Massilia sp.]|uniref:asparagine synthase (glutamine-hydrolyzing) n=1 Tax=uncultured Massilia sp. TaxID=169973 RepID=UPI0025D55DC4|nr:asparagine synthase (glutamine-hydrolyzing) [uncultured Massilia sp.]
MCGLVGFLGNGFGGDKAGAHAVVKRMTDAVLSRGPDDAGSWFCENGPIGLGHRRLAIVDLSPAGHQPMAAASGRYMMVFNGEIYNHALLRKELETGGKAPVWRGHSDTETLLAGFDAWGIQKTIERAIGMFAIAVWDRELKMLSLVRDRLGEKPLYYGWQGNGENAVFLFGSELSALRAHPHFVNKIDRGALSLLLRNSYIPAPYSIYQGISKLAPGKILCVSLEQREPKIVTYWAGDSVVEAGVRNPFAGSPEEAVIELEHLLMDAVRQQMMADVPLGAFLSGGVDSSTVVALMQAQATRPVKTFSIGFHEPGYNEAEHAKAVAAHLGTEHTELYVTSREAREVIPSLPSLYNEPFSDSSQIPTYLVSRLARQHVTVSLSGDAGDELFCGYNRYKMASRMWDNISMAPSVLRRVAAAGITSISPKHWNVLAGSVKGVLPRSLRFANVGDKLHKGAAVLASRDFDSLYLHLCAHWYDPAEVVVDGFQPPTVLVEDAPRLEGLDKIQRMMALDMLAYLPDDILAKVDRAAMGVSLETRVPMLDHRVVEFAWKLPQSLKLREGQSKWVLREVLYRHVPKALIERPKMGFAVPIADWLRGPLRDWAETLLDERRLREEGYFHAGPIRTKWKQHLSGQRNWQAHLWDVLMFQSWLEHNR